MQQAKVDAGADIAAPGAHANVDAAQKRLSKIREERASFQRQLEETRNKTWTRLLLERLKVLVPVFAVLLGAVLIAGLVLEDEVVAVFEWAEEHKPVSVAYYSLLMALWLLLFMSKSVFSLAGGYVFGFSYGLLGSICGMMLGLILTILLVRTVFAWCGWRQRLRSWLLENYLEIRVLNDLMKTEPARAIFLVKMSFFPTWLKSYSLAVLDAPSHIHLACQLVSGSIYSAIFCYLGSVASTIVEAIDGGSSVGGGSIIANAFGILMTFVVIIYIGYKVKAAIRQAEDRFNAELAEEEKVAEAEVAEATAQDV
ncbi:Hypothetical Protein FCC1311_088172 [Hondaea fermentalgiana]|uniref:Golgi apparatus membrane protein TVP38 n=1 Tax=Hondaea fermentalgiana TaxID=2315210 RepID=A0A2R5GNY1_9STRA|nr:Hypothetical Protein FCC1311_088172 [Hondaea fermentalgiana]|eukprot:GBG32592.1 Hypothetical Protein FCC1311_088172 [Hondaea fermentalgiana]